MVCHVPRFALQFFLLNLQQEGLAIDTFCVINLCWYEAKVVKLGEAGGIHEGQVLVHFKGWGKNADEWLRLLSDQQRALQQRQAFTGKDKGNHPLRALR